MKEWLIYNKRKRGYVENSVYYSHRDSRTHYFIKFNGYSLSVKILSELQRREVEIVRFIIDNDKIIETEVLIFYNFGQGYTDTSEDMEDKQLVLNISHFKEIGKIEEIQEKLF